MSNVKIGINPLTWTNDDMPSLGADTPLEVCLSESRDAGYAGVELGNKFPRDSQVLSPILSQFDRELVSGWYSSELLNRSAEEEIDSLQSHLHLLRASGCQVMVYCEVTRAIHGEMKTGLSRRPTMTEAEWNLFIPRLNQVADYLAGAGVAMAYHHHMGTVIQTEDDIGRMMEASNDNVGLLLDTGHLTYAGGNIGNTLEKWANRINHVHCKDIRPDVLQDAVNRDLPFLKAVLNGVFTVPGDGSINYQSLCKQLKRSDYKGWLVVEAEQDPAVAHPLTYATKGYECLSECVSNAGL